MREIKQNSDANIKLFFASDADHITGKTGLSIDIEISKDNESTFTNIISAANNLEIGYGWYQIPLYNSNNHTDTLGDLIIRGTGIDADPAERVLSIVENIESDTYSTVQPLSGDFLSIKGSGFDTNQHSLTKIKNRIG